jgi:Ca2+-transporting ATPase
VLFIATILNWREPLLPIHILWVNLVTDSLPALALGVEPAERDIMDRKPRSPQRKIFDNGMMVRIIYQGIMIGALTLIAYSIGIKTDWVTGQTMAFCVLALSQLVHVLNVRSNKHSIFQIGFTTNPRIIMAIVISAMAQLSVVCIPFLAKVFKVTTLNFGQWMWVLILSLMPLVVVEILKLLRYNTAKEEV